MDRRNKVLGRVTPASLVGIEIGPLDNPIILPEDGTIYYVDHVSTEDLRAKYAHDPAVDDDRVVNVDFTWGRESLAELLSGVVPIDYIVASHVIEHVPDMVGWLKEAAAVLAVGGSLELVIPDKRFTFDYLRETSTLPQLVGAYLDQLRRPSPQQVFAHFSQAVEMDATDAWAAPVSGVGLKRRHSIDEALGFANRSAGGEYVDAHCWVFTPESFVARFADLVDLGWVDLAIAELTTTPKDDLEFHVSLSKLDPSADDESRLAQRQGLTEAARRIDVAETPPDAGAPDAGISRSALQGAIEERDQRLRSMESSTSWRVTAPLRLLGRTIRRLSD